MSTARWSHADKMAGIGSVVLLVSLFLPWFTWRVGALGFSLTGTESHGYLWLVFLTCLGIVAFLVLSAGFNPAPAAREAILLAATAVNLLLVALAFFVNPGVIGDGAGWSFGAFLSLVAAVSACAPLALRSAPRTPRGARPRTGPR